jgi:hypothetical protein
MGTEVRIRTPLLTKDDEIELSQPLEREDGADRRAALDTGWWGGGDATG